MWCPSCGYEYGPDLAACPECGTPLVENLPDAPPTEAETATEWDRGSHDQVWWDLSPWRDDQRAGLDLFLRDIPHEWDEGRLTVPIVHEQQVESLIDLVDSDDELLEAGVVTADELTTPVPRTTRQPTAGLVRRGIARTLDEWVVAAVLFPLLNSPFGRGERQPWAPAVLVVATYLVEVGCLTRFGKTLGKAVTGLAVVDEGERRPRLGTVIRRTTVVQGAPLIAGMVASIGGLRIVGMVLMLAWYLVLGFSIAYDGWKRGPHDRFAGTRVVIAEGSLGNPTR